MNVVVMAGVEKIYVGAIIVDVGEPVATAAADRLTVEATMSPIVLKCYPYR